MKLSTIADRVIKKLVRLGPQGWIKGADAKTKDGRMVNPHAKTACSFCNEGIVMCVLDIERDVQNDPKFQELDEAFNRLAGNNMVAFNDNQYTTFGSNLEIWFQLRDELKAQGR